MGVTLSDIARETSLAQITVSQILRGTGTVRPETRMRVLEAARKLGYQPNSAARAMRKGRFDTVGLLFRNESYNIDLPASVIGAIADTIEARGLKMILIKTPDDLLLQPHSLPGLSSAFMVDGVIVSCWGEIRAELRDMVETAEYPACWVNSDSPLNSVRPDDRGAGRMATEHLLRMGHRAIAYVDYSGSNHFSTKDRRDGYKDAMSDAGLTPRIVQKKIATENRFEEAISLFPAGDRPSAVVTYCAHEAQPIIFAAAHLGLRVPRDVSVVTFEGRVANAMGIAISSSIFPEREIGVESANILLARIEGNGRAMSSVTAPFKEIIGRTCAPPSCDVRTNARRLKR